MENRRKGFTLIELLAVIVVLSTVGVIIGINLSKRLEDTNNKKCEEYIKEVEEAACAYSALPNQSEWCVRGNCTISVETLVKDGLILSEKDACTNEAPSGTVSVTWDNDGEKTCKYIGD